MACDVCGGSIFSIMGWLGRYRWYRCRKCGADCYKEFDRMDADKE